ncbi:MAG TPA: hypothetical protein DC054_26340 [Blastocatellia bacterium]|nr:hypothetical protein [Blastocatellia bacterium]
MRAQTEQPLPHERTLDVRPIELQTENGFSIVRQWEAEQKPPPSDGTFAFIVRNPNCEERRIIVAVADNLVARTQFQAAGRPRLSGDYWIYCAERRLANHLWENEDFPPNDRIRIEELEREDLLVALRWQRSPPF